MVLHLSFSSLTPTDRVPNRGCTSSLGPGVRMALGIVTDDTCWTWSRSEKETVITLSYGDEGWGNIRHYRRTWPILTDTDPSSPSLSGSSLLRGELWTLWTSAYSWCFHLVLCLLGILVDRGEGDGLWNENSGFRLGSDTSQLWS